MSVQEARLHDSVSADVNEQFLFDRSASFTQRAAAVAAIAAVDAAGVDREGRFPQAAIDAARKERLLGLRSRPHSAATAHRSSTSPTCATRLVAPALPPR